MKTENYIPINKAFSSVALEYETEETNIHKIYRKQVIDNLDSFIKPTMNILEINAGTGIDALYLLQNYDIHLTTIDISDKMVEYLKYKREKYQLFDRWHIEQMSFTELSTLKNKQFDMVFSNMGGLNCLDNLSDFTNQLENILNPNAIISLVIMPRICLWEIKNLLKGNWRFATRRWSGKTTAFINGNPFKVYYYNYQNVLDAFNNLYQKISVQSIAPFSPTATIHNQYLAEKYPKIFAFLIKLDKLCNTHFPFNRMGDFLIINLQFKPINK